MDEGMPLRIKDERRQSGHFLHKLIDVLVIWLTTVIAGWDEFTVTEDFGKAKEAVKPRPGLDGDNLIPYAAYLSMSTGKVRDVQGLAEPCDESGVIYALDRGYVLIINPYT
jgi:hypothetical protein